MKPIRLAIVAAALTLPAASAGATAMVMYQGQWPISIAGISDPLEPAANNCTNIENAVFVVEQVSYVGPGLSELVNGFIGRSVQANPEGHHLRRVFHVDERNLYKAIPDSRTDDVMQVIHVGAKLHVEYQACGSGGYTQALAVRIDRH